MSCLNCQYINPLGGAYFKCKVAPTCPATQNKTIVDFVKDNPIEAKYALEIASDNMMYFGICKADLSNEGRRVFDELYSLAHTPIIPVKQTYKLEFVTDDGIITKLITDDRFMSVFHLKSFIKNILYELDDTDIEFQFETISTSLFSDEYTISLI